MAKKHDSTKTQKKKQLPSSWRNSKRPYAVISGILVALVGTFLIISSFAATSTDSLSLTPASGNQGLGSTFTVKLMENSNTDAINSVQATLTYPTGSLTCTGVDVTTASGNAFNVDTGSSCANGAISIGVGVHGSTGAATLTGSQQVAIITFKAVGVGAAAVNFGCIYQNATTCPTGSGLFTGTGTNVLGTQTNASFTVADVTPPSTPTGLTWASHTITSLGLSWTTSTDDVGVTGYKIYRNGTQIGTSTTTTYTDTGLTPNTSYTYTVAAYDAAGNTSSQSTSLVAKTDPDTTAPTVPGKPTQTSRTMTSQVIGWTASTDNVGVVGYKVYRDGTQVGTSSTTTYTDSGLTPNTSYTYTVAAYDAAGNTSAQSSSAALATAPDTSAPTTPTGLTANGGSVSVVLNWTASTDNVGVTGYKIYKNGSTTALATVTGTTYADTAIAPSTTYTYQVSAIDAAGNESAKTSTVTVTTTANGDLNGDGHVNIVDLSIFLSHWQQTGTGLPEDFNNDNIVNIVDLSILLSHYGS